MWTSCRKKNNQLETATMLNLWRRKSNASAENQMKTAIIKTMSENEKSSGQCFHSVRAPILGSPKGNLKSSSPSKSSCDKVLSNVVQSSLIIIDKTDLEIMWYQQKVPIVMMLEIPVGTQIPKILRSFSC